MRRENGKIKSLFETVARMGKEMDENILLENEGA